jgi:electron transport complex protein RnfA
MFLALSFVGGVLLTMVLIHYISKRSYLDSIPVMLRGRPLILISLGLLSLIFTSLTVIFLRILDIF